MSGPQPAHTSKLIHASMATLLLCVCCSCSTCLMRACLTAHASQHCISESLMCGLQQCCACHMLESRVSMRRCTPRHVLPCLAPMLTLLIPTIYTRVPSIYVYVYRISSGTIPKTSFLFTHPLSSNLACLWSLTSSTPTTPTHFPGTTKRSLTLYTVER